MSTPSEVIEKHASAGEIDVPEKGGTVSWADIERDTSGWLGNAMQWAYYTTLRRLEPIVHEADDAEFLKLWRYFQTSDHLYYMFTAGGGPGEVHSYFSPYESPMDAFAVAHALLLDFEAQTATGNVNCERAVPVPHGSGRRKLHGHHVLEPKRLRQSAPNG